ncbi:MAG: head-tail connector protein [Betaproteobacteria bacterium]
MALVLITPPDVEPVTLQEAKAHLRIDGTEEDALITALITAAREYCEACQSRAYLEQTWELVLDAFPKEAYIELPRPPLRSIVSVKYIDKDGAETTWDPTNYVVDTASQPGRLVLAYGKTWPAVTLRPAGVRVQYKAGYGTAASAVPARVRQAMLLLIGHWYEHRETVNIGNIVTEIPMAAEALLWQDRVVTFG